MSADSQNLGSGVLPEWIGTCSTPFQETDLRGKLGFKIMGARYVGIFANLTLARAQGATFPS
jgi:hypothetical protein